MNSETKNNKGYPPPPPYECSACGEHFSACHHFDNLDRCPDCSRIDRPPDWYLDDDEDYESRYDKWWEYPR